MSEDKKNEEDKNKANGTLTIGDSTIDITDIKLEPPTYASSGTITTSIPYQPIYHDWAHEWRMAPNVGTCSKCKKKEEVHARYNWSEDSKLQRIICKKCHTKTMDKLYGLDNNVDAEVTLYEEAKREE